MRVALAWLPVLLTAMGAQTCAGVDQDGDGYDEDADCDDTNAAVHPDAAELCDGIDNNCDGAVDEGCGPALEIPYRFSSIQVQGEDNGRAEPNTFFSSDATSLLGGWSGAVGGQLEYVSATSSQDSYVDGAFVAFWGQSSAGGADDYGYGQGQAVANQVMYLEFEVTRPVTFLLSGGLSVDREFDGGSGYGRVGLIRGDGEVVYERTLEVVGSADLRFDGVLEPGLWYFDVELDARVQLSGGGDAYPAGSAQVELEATLGEP